HLESLTLNRCDEVDDRLGPTLRDMKKLRQLYLGGTAVSDKTMKVIGTLTGLELLRLDRTKVTDAGLAMLRGHPNLAQVALSDMAVTDESVDVIASWPNLKKVRLTNTRITTGFAELARRRPDIAINPRDW